MEKYVEEIEKLHGKNPCLSSKHSRGAGVLAELEKVRRRFELQERKDDVWMTDLEIRELKKSRNVCWAAATDLSEFDEQLLHPELQLKHKMSLECISPDDFLHKQYVIALRNPAWKPMNEEQFLSDLSEQGKERIRQGLLSGDCVVPTPVLEYEADGTLHPFQEGRHRAVVARELRLETMPVWVAKRRQPLPPIWRQG